MAPFRGRARPAQTGRLARSGIRTRGGQYKKFDSQRVAEAAPEVQSSGSGSEHIASELEGESDSDDDVPSTNAYTSLLASLKPDTNTSGSQPRKRRKLSPSVKESTGLNVHFTSNGDTGNSPQTPSDEESVTNLDAPSTKSEDSDHDSDHEVDLSDPYEKHFVKQDEEVSRLVEDATNGSRQLKNIDHPSGTIITAILPEDLRTLTAKSVKASDIKDLHLKQRIQLQAQKDSAWTGDQQNLLPYLFNYVDILSGNRTPRNAAQLRYVISLHAVNHILKGRDKVLKNNTRLAQANDDDMLEFRDQGFTRPKVLILTETRQMCAKYAEAIVKIFGPEQQENARRFNEAFSAPVEHRDMPEDFNELFEGNNDNNFLTTIKFTRKTLKFYSAFYQSDIVFASSLGIQRIIENEDKRKRDHDFLSSIELVIVDQADAIQMQNFENIEIVFKHLNLQPKELRDCDVNRVRNWYLDGNAQHFRQTIVLSNYLTPELNKLYNTNMKNVSGKVKLTRQYPGAIQAATGMGIKQVFSRFSPKSPADDPDARFKFFTTSVLPLLLRLPRPSSGGPGILIFIPSYFDFLRVRNFFATSAMTENISFGAINDYSDVSEQRRARSHFSSGRHSFLLYTQRAHHFFRLRLRGVKSVVLYGLPDNEIFYREVVAEFLSSSVEQGSVAAEECTARSIFCKFDALRMQRIVGTDRAKNMLTGVGDTFDFV